MSDPIQLESPASNINRARYASRDFFTHVDDLVARIQVMFVTEFNDFVTSGTGQMLIDIISWAAESLSFYIDRQATESYLATARTRKAVVRLARQNGYKVAGAVSAAVDLQVNLTKARAFNVPVPVGFQFLGPGGLVFEAIEAVTFLTGEGPTSPPRTVATRQGQTRVEIFASNGEKNQIFRLAPGAGNFVAAGSVVVEVDGLPWTESELITFDQTNQFELGLGDDPPTLRFGNGVAGNVPALNAEIRVQYIATAGANGLVTSGTIVGVVSPLVVGATAIPLTVTNPQPSSGGSDQESLERVKANAPRFYNARQVAVVRTDYEGLAQAYSDPLAGSVAVAQAFVARSADDDLQLQILLTNVRAITEALSGNVQAQTALIDGDVGLLTGLRDTAASAVTSAQSQTSIIDTTEAAATTTAQTLRSRTKQINVDATDIKGYVTDGKAAVDSSSASAPQKATINGYFDLIETEADAILASNGLIDGDAASILSALGSIGDAADATTDRLSETATALADMSPLLADISAKVVVVNGLMTSGFEEAISAELDDIFAHVDGFLAADCQANLIQVPILTRDVDGFLAAPPIALLRSLQSYLDERKEVTQDPEVVSGENFLVRAVVTAKIGVLPGFVQATVVSNVRKAIDDLLRVRPFGASLRRSDLDAITSPNPQTGVGGVAGVKYSVFTIEGPIDFLDGDGNLIIDQRHVITKGTVTLTAEAAAA